MSKYKVGDILEIVGNESDHGFYHGEVVEIIDTLKLKNGELAYSVKGEGDQWLVVEEDLSDLTFDTPPDMVNSSTKQASSGGPSGYYDMPFSAWVTVNDQMEYLAEKKWGKYGIHLKDIFKGLCRWGEKSGTSTEYDTRKIIYYGFRILRMLVGNKGVQKYLRELMDDPQFA